MSAGVALIVGSDEATAERIGRTIGYRAVALATATVAPPSASLLRGLEPSQLPEAIVFTDQIPVERSLVMASEIQRVRPDIDMVLVGDVDRQTILDAMRAGVRDIAPSVDDATFLASLRSRLDGRHDIVRKPSVNAPQVAVDFTSRTMTILSPKGGVGKTSMSANLAVALAEMSPMEVVLVDLDLQFGDLSTVLDLKPTYTLEDAFKAGTGDSLLLKTFLTVHPAGFYVLCGADNPAANEKVTGEQVQQLIRQLQSQFRYVIVDTAAGIDDATLASLEVSHDAIVVSTMDMACLRSVRKAFELLTELSLMPPSRHVVVNFADKQSGLRIKDVEAVLGVPADFVVPRAREIPAAANKGVPVLISSKSGPVVKAVKGLAKKIFDRAREAEAKPGHKRLEVA